VIDANGHWAAGSDTLIIQMGDIVDRGPDSAKIYELLRRLRAEAEQLTPDGETPKRNLRQLLGNHEVMNLCGRYYHVHPDEVKHYYENSAEKMRLEWTAGGTTGADMRANFEVAIQEGEVVFVHAGIVPRFASVGFDFLKERLFDQIDDEGCPYTPYPPSHLHPLAWTDSTDSDSELDVIGEIGPLWTRLLTMEDESVSCAMLEESLASIGNGAEMMVVGHTPTNGRIGTRCSNRLVMIDTAISRWIGNSPTAFVLEGEMWKEYWLDTPGVARQRNVHIRNLFPSKPSKAANAAQQLESQQLKAKQLKAQQVKAQQLKAQQLKSQAKSQQLKSQLADRLVVPVVNVGRAVIFGSEF